MIEGSNIQIIRKEIIVLLAFASLFVTLATLSVKR
jgi:hypothetical protein